MAAGRHNWAALRRYERNAQRASDSHGRKQVALTRLKIITAVVAALALIAPAQAQPILRDAEIEQWLDDYAHPVFRAAGLPAEQIQILIVGDQTINAFASGMLMGVNTGLFTNADTPNQIEGVIAHEAGHIAGGHIARSDEAIAAASRPMILSLVLAAGAIAAGAPDAGIGILGLGQTVGTANVLKYSRGQEASADQAAVTYLDALHHSSAGLVEFFSKMRNSEIITNRRVNPYMQNHPLSNQRVTALTERVGKSPYFAVKNSPEEIERLNLLKAKINGFMQDTNVTLRQYPLTDQSDPAHYARAVAYYRGSKLDKASKEIDLLIEKFPDNPYYQELKGQMLFEFGHVEESIPSHARSVELAPSKALLRINLGRALIATEDAARYPEAIKQLKAALLVEPDNSFAWSELARAYGGLGDDAMADLATAESKYHAGAPGEAAIFARRAMSGLKHETPEYRQALDIIAAAQAAGNGRGRGGARAPQPDPERKDPGEDDGSPAPAPQRDGDVPDPTAH